VPKAIHVIACPRRSTGFLQRNRDKVPFLDTVPGRLAVQLGMLYGPILVGAVVFRWLEGGEHVTLVDALYFATVTSTSIG